MYIINALPLIDVFSFSSASDLINLLNGLESILRNVPIIPLGSVSLLLKLESFILLVERKTGVIVNRLI